MERTTLSGVEAKPSSREPLGSSEIIQPSSLASSPAIPAQATVYEQYVWITNEGLLRDEGTLFGMALADISDKLKAIDDYFTMRGASFSEKLHLLKEKIAKDLLSKNDLIEKEEVLNQNFSQHTFLPHNFLPVIIQLIAYGAVCFFNYYLVDEWLSPVMDSFLIPLGLYLFGISGLFLGRSLLYNHNEKVTDKNGLIEGREKWKIYLEEFGIPLIAASTVIVLAWEAHAIGASVLIGLTLFFLFLFSGKGFINLLYQARKEFKSFYQNFLVVRAHRRNKRKIKKELVAISQQQEASTKEWEAIKMEMDKLQAELEYRKHLFISEYNLAGKSREMGVEI